MFPTSQVGNFSLSRAPTLWDFPRMSGADDLRGKALYDALMRLKPERLAETDWAEKSGVNRGFFTNLKGKDISPRSDTLRRLLDHIGRSMNDLEAATRGAALPVPDQPLTRDISAGETVEIIQLDLSLPMGPGATVDDYIEEEPRVFDLAYIRGFTRTPPHRLRIARGVGDSMFPTLQSADMVWIDSTQTHLNQADRIWAVSIHGMAAIKRLRRLGNGKVLIVSDNPTVDNYEVDEADIRIGGRVIRFARDV